MRYLFFFILYLVYLFPAYAQNDNENLNRLLRERQQLIKEYEYLNAQNSNFWGKKSKKDLLKIIENLKGIINKDSDIIREVNLAAIKKQAVITVEKSKLEDRVKDDKRMVGDNLYEFKNQIASLQNLNKVRQTEISDLKERMVDMQESGSSKDLVLVFAAVISLGLLFYIFRLRSQVAIRKR